jgi:hypothetical protein
MGNFSVHVETNKFNRSKYPVLLSFTAVNPNIRAINRPELIASNMTL